MVAEIMATVREGQRTAETRIHVAMSLIELAKETGEVRDNLDAREAITEAKLAIEDHRRARELARGMIKAQRAAGF